MDEKAKALARLRVVRALLAEVYQEYDSALRQLEIAELKQVDNIFPFKDSKTSEDTAKSDYAHRIFPNPPILP